MGSQGEVHYFVMEYVEGVNLRQLMATSEVTPQRALALVALIALGRGVRVAGRAHGLSLRGVLRGALWSGGALAPCAASASR